MADLGTEIDRTSHYAAARKTSGLHRLYGGFLAQKGVSALAQIQAERGPIVSLLADAKTPRFRTNRFNRRNPIIGMEMLSPLALL